MIQGKQDKGQLIKNSWYRCHQKGIKKELNKVKKFVRKRKLNRIKKENKKLIKLFKNKTREIIDKYCTKSYIFILTNFQGVVIAINCNSKHKHVINEGDYLTEESCGTNAISLAIEAEKSIYLAEEEHYCQFLRKWSCIAAPLEVNNNIVGYLDVSIQEIETTEKQELLFDLLFNYLTCRLTRQVIGGEDNMEGNLSDLQFEILKLSANGHKIKDISKHLHTSETNVKYHRRRIRQILRAENMPHAIAKAIKYKYLLLDEIK